MGCFLLYCADIAEAYKKLNKGFILFTLQLNCYENLHTLNQQQSQLYEVIKDGGEAYKT